jgi:hypothetical protein
MSVAHDHPSVGTVEGAVRIDRLDRPRVWVPDGPPTDEVVRLVLDGAEYRAQFRPDDGGAVLRGAYDTAEQAREPGDATDRLDEWIDAAGLEAGRTVHLDVVEEGFRYGLRAPGEGAVYDTGRPPSSLADIARDLGE